MALREALGVSERVFSEQYILSLDEGGFVHLKPDLTWQDGGDYMLVGDVKYKNITGGHEPNADLYQLLAYVTALDLPGGLLIYTEGEADTRTHNVRRSGERLEVTALDLSGTLDEALARVDRVASRVRALRHEARKRTLTPAPEQSEGVAPAKTRKAAEVSVV